MKAEIHDLLRWIIGAVTIAYCSHTLSACARTDYNRPKLEIQEDCRDTPRQ